MTRRGPPAARPRWAVLAGRAITGLLPFVAGAGVPALAADAPATAPRPGPAAPSLREVVDAVAAAARAGDAAGLLLLASASTPDPWDVVDRLLGRGEGDAATAFTAMLPPHVDVAALPLYVEQQRLRGDDVAARAAINAARAAVANGDGAAALEALASVDVDPGTTLDALATYWRGRGEALLGHPHAAPSLAAAAAAADRLGWDHFAAAASEEEGRVHVRGDGFRSAIIAWQRALLRYERIGGVAEAAQIRTKIANALGDLGERSRAVPIAARAVADLRGTAEPVALARALLALSGSLLELNRLDDADRSAHEALTIARAEGERELEAYALLRVAGVASRRDDSAAALALYQEALVLARALAAHDVEAASLGNMGAIRAELGDLEGARTLIDQRIAIERARGSPRGLATALGQRAGLEVTLREFDAAIATLDEAVAFDLASGDRSSAAQNRSNRARACIAQGRHAEARAILEVVERDHERHEEWREAADDATELVAACRSAGDPAAARRWGERALAIASSRGLPYQRAIAGGNLAQLELDAGRYAAALAAYQETERRFDALGRRREVAATRLNLGICAAHLGDARRAGELYEAALAAADRLGDDELRINVLSSQAELARAQGELATAHALFERAREIALRRRDDGAGARLLISLGSLEVSMGRHAEGLARLEAARDATRALGLSGAQAQALGALGSLQASLGDPDRARGLFEASIDIRRRLGDAPGLSAALGNLGLLQQDVGDDDAARRSFQEAYELAKGLGDPSAVPVPAINLASALARAGALDVAEAKLAEAVTIARAHGLRKALVASLRATAHVVMAAGRAREGLEAAEAAVLAMEGLDAPEERSGALEALARARAAVGDWDGSLAAARRSSAVLASLGTGLDDRQELSTRAARSGARDLGVRAAAHLGDVVAAAEFIEGGRGSALSAALEGRERLRAIVVPEALRHDEERARLVEADAARALDRALAAGDTPATAMAATALGAARDASAEVVARIQRATKGAADLVYPAPDDLATIQARLAPDEALVEFAVPDDDDASAYALVATRATARLVDLGAARGLAVSDPRETIGAKDSVDAVGELARLRRRLVEPLGLGGAVRRVLVSPDGALAIVPFGALFEDREVALVPSGTVHGLLFPDRATRGDGVLALGDPTYPSTPEPATVLALRGGGERTPLPGTRAEAVAISAEPFLGPRASEAELARALPGRPRWRALHFGCHGFVDPRRPLLSSLALAPDPEHDGYLTVQEVLRMRIPADLVTVSACESGRGRFYKGEGVMGFARAFMFAGAPRVVVSLWKVDDAATTALMTEFYRLWNPRDGSPGIAAATALTRAQAHVRADPRWAHPRFWAGWALWGLPQ